MTGQFKPPYNKSFQVPDPTVAQVLVEHNITHSYTVPGAAGGTAAWPGGSPFSAAWALPSGEGRRGVRVGWAGLLSPRFRSAGQKLALPVPFSECF